MSPGAFSFPFQRGNECGTSGIIDYSANLQARSGCGRLARAQCCGKVDCQGFLVGQAPSSPTFISRYVSEGPAKLSLAHRHVALMKSLLGKGGTTDFQVRQWGIRRTRKSVVLLNQPAVTLRVGILQSAARFTPLLPSEKQGSPYFPVPSSTKIL